MKTLILTLLLALTATAQVIVTAPDTVEPVNSEIAVEIWGEDLVDVIAYQWDILFDPKMLGVMPEKQNFGCTLVDTVAEEGLNVICNGRDSGRLRVVVWGCCPITEAEGAMVNIKFRTLLDGTTRLNFANGLVFKFPTGHVTATFVDGEILVK